MLTKRKINADKGSLSHSHRVCIVMFFHTIAQYHSKRNQNYHHASLRATGVVVVEVYEGKVDAEKSYVE